MIVVIMHGAYHGGVIVISCLYFSTKDVTIPK